MAERANIDEEIICAKRLCMPSPFEKYLVEAVVVVLRVGSSCGSILQVWNSAYNKERQYLLICFVFLHIRYAYKFDLLLYTSLI